MPSACRSPGRLPRGSAALPRSRPWPSPGRRWPTRPSGRRAAS